jgi:hypothetical protein
MTFKATFAAGGEATVAVKTLDRDRLHLAIAFDKRSADSPLRASVHVRDGVQCRTSPASPSARNAPRDPGSLRDQNIDLA